MDNEQGIWLIPVRLRGQFARMVADKAGYDQNMLRLALERSGGGRDQTLFSALGSERAQLMPALEDGLTGLFARFARPSFQVQD